MENNPFFVCLVIQYITVKKATNKVVAITGAASGIGKQLALQLAKQGAILALNDWNKDGLIDIVKEIELAGTPVFGFPFDVSHRQSWQSFADKIIQHYGHIDILINNAGIAQYPAPVEELGVEEFSRIFDVNMWGCIHGTQIILPLLKERPQSSLVNISSSLGLAGYPNQAAYSMSKFALKGLTETLQLENLSHKNLHIMGVHPGGVQTNFIRNIKNIKAERLNKLIKLFDQYSPTTASEAAQQIIKGIKKKKKRVVIGKDARYLDIITRFFPSFYHYLLPPAFNPNKASSQTAHQAYKVIAKKPVEA